MNYTIRVIEEKDNKQVEHVIRTCLIEFGANHEGTAWMDPNLGCFSEVYSSPKTRYWVALDESNTVICGVGIGPLPGAEGTCELQKMYCLKEHRGTGISHQLMKLALAFAKEHYEQCYLETLPNMYAAKKFYESCGFKLVDKPLVITDHYACDVRYLLKF